MLERLNKLLGDDVAHELIEKFVLEENDLLFLGIGEKRETVSFVLKLCINWSLVLIHCISSLSLLTANTIGSHTPRLS